MKQWKKEICDTQPEEVQLIAPELLMQRRNIKVVEHEATDNMEAYTDYECVIFNRFIRVNLFNAFDHFIL